MKTKNDRAAALLIVWALAGCAGKPLLPYSTDTVPLMLVPAVGQEAKDHRGRFREIFCAALEARKETAPDYRDCGQALTRVGREPDGSGKPVDLGPANRKFTVVFALGLGSDCFSGWLAEQDTIARHLRRFGYDLIRVQSGGLSDSSGNGRRIRDVILAQPSADQTPDLVLIGYSKGAVDSLQAVVDYPEIRSRLAAVVSIAGAIGGSPLANSASDAELNLMEYFPGSSCKPGGEGALSDLRPATRKAWLAENRLPEQIPFYSVVTFPDPKRISGMLRPSYRKLSRVDARNDSQLIFYDQVIPGSYLTAYLNADHLAASVAIARTHEIIGELAADQNDYPREVLFEALLRLVEEDLTRR